MKDLKGFKITEVHQDPDGYIDWIRIDKGSETLIIHAICNPVNGERRLALSKTS